MAVTTNFRKRNKTHRAPADAQNVALLNDLRHSLLTVWSSSSDMVQTIRRMLYLSFYKAWGLISYNLFFKLPHKLKSEVALFTGNWYRNFLRHFPTHTFEIEMHQTQKLLNWRRAYHRGGTLLQH